MRVKKVKVIVSVITLVLLSAIWLLVDAESPDPTVETTKAVSITKEELYPELVRICSCESTGSPNNTPRQFDDKGNVVIGKINKLDTGMCQINLHYHGERAKKLNIDLFTEAGNIKYANMLYKEQGSKPWDWSKKCWNK